MYKRVRSFVSKRSHTEILDLPRGGWRLIKYGETMRANVLLHHLELSFQVKKIWNVYITATVRTSAKLLGMTMIYFGIPYRMALLRMLYFGDIDLYFHGHKFVISLKRWGSAKICTIIFTEVDRYSSPSNYVFATVVLRDLDLNFKGKKFETFI